MFVIQENISNLQLNNFIFQANAWNSELNICNLPVKIILIDKSIFIPFLRSIFSFSWHFILYHGAGLCRLAILKVHPPIFKISAHAKLDNNNRDMIQMSGTSAGNQFKTSLVMDSWGFCLN